MAVKPAEFDPEEPVVEAVREGDRFAFAELVRRHEQWVRGVIFGVLGDPDRTE
ncbi:MAG: RNA polymerase subunit sigma-24, partial [Planctomycetes bacterium]|nr:RNA polymerase subunit sigma-24 [Planctomycetota bacterium]